MKYIKYFTICLLLALVASCSDKEVTYQMHKVDTSTQAQVEVFYVVPLKAQTSNYIYYVDLNGVEYGNNGSSFLATYNGVPSGGIARYYTVDAGTLSIKFKNSKSELMYEGTCTVEAGKKYQIFVYDFAQAPKVIENLEIPMFPGSDSTATHCSVRFINFLYEADGTPYEGKLQYALQNTETKEYEPIGEAVGFGEATSYFNPKIVKSIYNSSGYQRRDLVLLTDSVDAEGNKVPLEYINSKGNSVKFTDYWTWYIGRAYIQYLVGFRTSAAVQTVSLKQFTAL